MNRGRKGRSVSRRPRPRRSAGCSLIQLVGLEIEKLVGEYSEVAEEIDGYQNILGEMNRC